MCVRFLQSVLKSCLNNVNFEFKFNNVNLNLIQQVNLILSVGIVIVALPLKRFKTGSIPVRLTIYCIGNAVNGTCMLAI